MTVSRFKMSAYLAASLSELRDLRQKWLAEGRAAAHDLRLIVETFGQPVASRYHCVSYLTIKTARAQAWLYEHQGPWIGTTYEHRARLWIEVRQITAANIYFRNAQFVTEVDSVFIPGPWIDELLALAPGARDAVSERRAAIDERERRKLLEILGIGTLV